MPRSSLGLLEARQFWDQLNASTTDVHPRLFLVVLGNINVQVSLACSGSAADSYGGALGGMLPANTMPKAGNYWSSVLRPRPFLVTPSSSTTQHTSSAFTALVTRNISLTSSWCGSSSSTTCAVCSVARRQQPRQLHRQQTPPGVCHHVHAAQGACTSHLPQG